MAVDDGAIAEPAALARALRPRLGAHPVPQSDPRTRGLLLELSGSPDGHAWLRAELPELAGLFTRFAGDADSLYVLAVNQTPPTATDRFLLRPHVDRRWLGDGFGSAPPRWTTMVYLDFPTDARGGELAVFPRGAFDASGPVSRDGARQTVEHHHGVLVTPLPGRACRLSGELPHAVLGYSAAPQATWRLAIVLAEFARDPTEPPPRGLLT
ncbi:2OG-Fe(II) oxygenase [Pyxidicoccus caerfyrddinensis]|uniref:2OG-Fe(II) oxygenase n=1 Tax=Pyxidicoccus caerfyrddinensis TaxID=2709663 RepID=UPI0013DB7C63|nr:2OG-Fe(II) oxygenase [Pyxidicoccus caerfyrddinensis]